MKEIYMNCVRLHDKVTLDMPFNFMKADKRKWIAAREWDKQSGGEQTIPWPRSLELNNNYIA